jgi:hypothetical protein
MTPTDTRTLWPALLAGPLAWAAHLQGVFALSAWATEQGTAGVLHAVGAACLLVAAGGLGLAWWAWRATGGWPTGGEPPPAARARTLSTVGVMTGGLFVVVIAAQWAAVLLLPHTMGAG